MEKRLFFLINKARHRMQKYAEARSEAQLNVSVTQAAAILFIGKLEGCLQKELAKNLGLNHSAITGLVNRMIKNDLITRQNCEADGRASRLYLTELGQTKYPLIRPLIKELNEKLTEGFTDAEMDVVYRFLNKTAEEFKIKK